MLYLANPSTDGIRDAIRAGALGWLDTPRQRNRPEPGATWAADTGIFGTGYPGDDRWFGWLTEHPADRELCRFATAPDVVGDAEATLARSRPWLDRIVGLGYPVALVGQDGLTATRTLRDAIDVLFLGGPTAWKLSRDAADLAAEAIGRGLAVHMGRVNSARRYRHAELIGCASADGTILTLGPHQNLRRVLSWGRPEASLWAPTRRRST